jgi:hypothetical protein
MIKKLIEKIFGKFCKCGKPIVPQEIKEEVKEEVIIPEKIKCNTHSRYKKSCPICVEAGNI